MRKVAVITGGTRGIGLDIAKRFAQDGYDTILIARSAPKPGILDEIRQNGVDAEFIAADISNFEECRTTVSAIKKQKGHIDVLVNNAGITRDGLIIRMSEEEFDSVIAINLKGAFNMIRHITPVMLKQKSGNIINLSSVVGVMGNIGQANYAASKAGLIGLTKSTAKELASRGIIVNAIAPGFIQTEMTESLSEALKEAMLGAIPLKRFGLAQEVAELAAYLARQTYITGQVIQIDGGMVM